MQNGAVQIVRIHAAAVKCNGSYLGNNGSFVQIGHTPDPTLIDFVGATTERVWEPMRKSSSMEDFSRTIV